MNQIDPPLRNCIPLTIPHHSKDPSVYTLFHPMIRLQTVYTSTRHKSTT